jgi:hypothetical protein
MSNDEFRLYILVRTDTKSLNPGKGMAQVAHAANQLSEMALRGVKATANAYSTEQLKDAHESHAKLKHAYEEWAGEGEDYRGFGTTIVLASEEPDQDFEWVRSELARRQCHVGMGTVVDPTYPVRDGAVTHLVSFPTCMWVFGRVSDLQPVLETFKLHP